MKKLLTTKEINDFKLNGAIILRKKFDVHWIEKLKSGIAKDIKSPSPRFKSHTTQKNIPAYLEDYWTWDLVPEFKDFVFNSPVSQIASELMSAKKVNLLMDNWFLREAGAKSSTPFHHDISYFDVNGTMCILWLPLEATGKDEELLGSKAHIYGIKFF